MKLFKKIITLMLVMTFAVGAFVSDYSTVEAAKKKTVKQKDIVVVLDPGHDSVHHGFQAYNLDEATINLYIAYYCKNELERYNGVKVYMTRYGFECPYGANPDSASGCLSARVDYAKKLKADFYVSIHNDYDADVDPNVSGCKVIIPNPNYRPDLCVAGYNMASSILTQLTATGLKIDDWKMCPNGTGIVTRDSAGGKYPDGSAKDYYAVINKTKSNGMPGIIIEHAYVTNKADRENHLSTVEQYQQLGVADATAIANYYGLKLK
ncbi:MAG: N-acetylmuramoyl-L-alanine amidase [Pseudobutyrivibrio sp.]|nr:N-acetylmuramoyl-L-alanine amidase [Pseudobutyrivibrio sp.]